jgi:microsomal dipeptidase-like Zn-dependent dipeptidase
MQPIIAHKGTHRFRCAVHGREAHSSYVTYGVNAIEYAARLIVYIRQIADRLAQIEKRDYGFTVPYSTLSTGLIRGGIAANVIPKDCEFQFDMRTLPMRTRRHRRSAQTQRIRDPRTVGSMRGLHESNSRDRVRAADMVAGGVAGGSFAAVANVEILGLRKGALGWTREFRPGEARASYERQIANLNEWVRKGGATVALAPDDIVRLHSRKRIAALLMVEGGDFLAGDARYVRRAFTDGVRSITLVHYHPNEIGDNQTAEPQSGGLTAFGREVVAEMDHVGMVIDVAHASEDTVRGVLKTTRNPVMCSHTLLAGHGPQNPRFISDALALEIAARGGVIGAWPSGFGSTTMNDYIDHILTLSRVVGPEHVGFGTDKKLSTSATIIPDALNIKLI